MKCAGEWKGQRDQETFLDSHPQGKMVLGATTNDAQGSQEGVRRQCRVSANVNILQANGVATGHLIAQKHLYVTHIL